MEMKAYKMVNKDGMRRGVEGGLGDGNEDISNGGYGCYKRVEMGKQMVERDL